MPMPSAASLLTVSGSQIQIAPGEGLKGGRQRGHDAAEAKGVDSGLMDIGGSQKVAQQDRVFIGRFLGDRARPPGETPSRAIHKPR